MPKKNSAKKKRGKTAFRDMIESQSCFMLNMNVRREKFTKCFYTSHDRHRGSSSLTCEKKNMKPSTMSSFVGLHEVSHFASSKVISVESSLKIYSECCFQVCTYKNSLSPEDESEKSGPEEEDFSLVKISVLKSLLYLWRFSCFFK